jgi:integrase
MAKKEKTTRKARRGRGEGSVTFREDCQLWCGRVSLVMGDGRRKRKVVYGKTKSEALDKMSALRAKATGGTLPDSGSMTVGQLMTRWLETTQASLAVTSHEVRTSTVSTHVVPRLGGVRLAKLTPLHVEGFYADMLRDGVGPGAARHAAVFLSGALNHAVRLRLIPSNPCIGITKPPQPRREMLSLDRPGAQALLDAAKGRPACALVTLALGTGCRLGELLALAWDDLDLDAGSLTVRRSLAQTSAGFTLKEPKTRAARRTLTLPPFALASMREHRVAQLRKGLIGSPVFCTRSGGYVNRANVLRALRAVIDRVNDPQKAERKGGRPKKGHKPPPRPAKLNVIPEKLRFHDLRHSHASLLLSGGQSLRAVSQRLGHSDPALTLRIYAHALPGDDATLAESLGKMFG